MRTAYIIGAGASTDFGLPAGPALQRLIADFVNPDLAEGHDYNQELERIADQLEARGLSYSDQYELCSWFSRVLPLANSIDSFLETQSRPGDAVSFLGKYAITTLISQAERASPLFVERRNKIDFSSIGKTWLGRLWPKINRGGSANIVEKGLRDTSFITFNYDRCIEAFLFHAFKDYYKLSREGAVEFVNNVKIHHVYGSLGDPFGGVDLEFGADLFCPARIDASNKIKTYSEELREDKLKELADILIQSDRIIFIGFSFLPINQMLLKSAIDLNGEILQLKQVTGTAFKMSHHDTQRAAQWCDFTFRRGNPGANLQQVSGADFFDQNTLLFS